MIRNTYSGQLSKMLVQFDFERDGSWWSRTRGDMLEQIDLQKSRATGAVTVNLWAKDLVTEAMLRAIPCKHTLGITQSSLRLGTLIDGKDRWWKNDPNGPAEVAELVRVHAIPWFDRVRTLEEQAEKWFGRRAYVGWASPNLGALAMTLYRLGELDEALAIFDAPMRRTANPDYVASLRCVEAWLQEQKALKESSPPSP